MPTKYFKRTFIRPSTTVPFYESDATFTTAIKNSVASTNSCIKWREKLLSDDELTLTWLSSWNSDFIDSQQGIDYLDSIEELLYRDINAASIYCSIFEFEMSELVVYTE